VADRLFAGVIEAPEGPWTVDDRAWLQAHPTLDVRIRAPYPGELGPLFDPPGVANAREFRTVYSNAARRYRTRHPELVMRVAVLRALGGAYVRLACLAPPGEDARAFLVTPSHERVSPGAIVALVQAGARVALPELRVVPFEHPSCDRCRRALGSSDICAGCGGELLCLSCALPWMRAHTELPAVFGLVIEGPADMSDDALRVWSRLTTFVRILEGTTDRGRAIELVEHHLANGGVAS